MTEFPCVVCNRLYDGTTHCSVMACRACAMFYKRYQEFTQMPLCQRNSKKCYINDLSIVSCTTCRFYRCLKAGLKRQENSRSLTHKAELVKYQSAQKTNLLLKLDTVMLVAETMPTLNRFCYHYAINCNDRKKQELNLLQSDCEKLIKFSGNKSMGYMTQSRSNRLYEGVFAGFQRLARDTFPVFLTMHNDVQDSIFNRLMIFYSDLFGSFNTLRIFHDVNTTKLACSECMYVDIDDVGRFLDHMESPDPMDNQAIIDYFSIIWRGFLNTTLPVMHRMNISDVEFLAVCTLIIWDKDSFIQLPHLNKMAETHRQMIYHDLEYYYKNIMKLDNYVDRVINIHDLINTIKKNVVTMIESVHFFKTFNYYKESEEILEATQKMIDSVELREY